MTTFENKCYILSDLWLNYRHDKDFEDFVYYNDLGLPLSYLISEDIVQPSDVAQSMVEESFSLLLAGLDIEDTGFENLDQVLSSRK